MFDDYMMMFFFFSQCQGFFSDILFQELTKTRMVYSKKVQKLSLGQYLFKKVHFCSILGTKVPENHLGTKCSLAFERILPK